MHYPRFSTLFKHLQSGNDEVNGSPHGFTSTLATINNLDILCNGQGKLDEAEQMYLQALVGFRCTLRNVNTPSQAAISGFTAALSVSIRSGAFDDSVPQLWLLELSDHVQK